MSPLLRNILFALGIAIVLWLGYVFLIESDDTLVSESVISPAVRDGQELLLQLRQLEKVNISGDLFTDLRFKSLVDLRQEIIEEERGRVNPFLPFPEEESEETQE